MANANISAVIFDLDGTLLDTERATKNVLKDFLGEYGKEADPEKEEKRVGKMFKDSAVDIVRDYELPLTPDQFADAIMPLYHQRWHEAKALPGVNRLFKHLQKHGIPFALASNSIRQHIEMKISHQPGWKEMFAVILGGDEVSHGKPAPDIFLEAAKRLGLDTSNCLVIEDSPVGVRAAKASGANVVAVPSLQNQEEHYSIANCVLNSLLEFQPDLWGFPKFEDWVQDALLIEPLHIRGLIGDSVSNNGCTTVNIIADESSYVSLPDQATGVFFGWARLQIQGVFKVVVAIGWDLSAGNAERAIKTRLFGNINDNISKEQFHMMFVGYIRKLSNEVGIAEALSLCEEDNIVTQTALDLPVFSHHTISSLLSEKCCKK